MVDNMNPAPVPPADPGTGPVPEKQGFFSSTLGKVLLGVVALAVVLGLLGAVAFFFLGNGLMQDDSGQPDTAATSTQPAASTPTGDEAESGEPQEAEPMSDVFAFRNPFVPTVKPVVTSTSSSSSDTSSTSSSTSGSGTDAGSVPANTLALTSITTQDGEYVATFIWNGKTFTASEGDELEGTPWKVVNLTATSATMLYGDSEVTLSVGQGISK